MHRLHICTIECVIGDQVVFSSRRLTYNYKWTKIMLNITYFNPFYTFRIFFLSSGDIQDGRWIPVGHTFLNVCKCSQRNVRLLGDGFIAFAFDILVYNFHSHPFCPISRSLSPVHISCITRHVTKQQLLDFLKIDRLTANKFEHTCSADWRTRLGQNCLRGQVSNVTNLKTYIEHFKRP